MAICRFCKCSDKKLIKAHIIPRSIFKLVKKDENYSVYFEARQEGVRTDFKQAGLYDETILCAECEARFSNWDAHGSAVISKPRGEADLYRDPQGIACGYHLKDADYELFMMFLLAVLWRASVSTLQFFRQVRLGPHEERILSILKEGGPVPDAYSAVLIHPLKQRYPGTIMPSWKGRIDGVWFHRLYFPDVIAMIKVDQRPTPRIFRPIQLRPDRDNYLVFLPYERTAEEAYFNEMRSFMKKHGLFDQSKG